MRGFIHVDHIPAIECRTLPRVTIYLGKKEIRVTVKAALFSR